jgi:hypothetical protein
MIYLSPVSDQLGSISNLARCTISDYLHSSDFTAIYVLWPFIDEVDFHQQSEQTTIFQFSAKLALQKVTVAAIEWLRSASRILWRHVHPAVKLTGEHCLFRAVFSAQSTISLHQWICWA